MNEETQSLFEQGLALYNRGSDKKALIALNEAITLTPDHIPSRLVRAQVYWNSHQPEKALEDLHQILELDSQNAEAYYWLGHVYASQKQRQEAITHYSQAIVLNPTFADAYRDRALEYQFLGQYQDALTDYNTLLELKPDDAWGHINRGRSRYALGDHREALKDYYRGVCRGAEPQLVWHKSSMHILPELDAIITQWPDLAEAYFFRGEIYLSSKKFDEALADFNRAIELMPNELQFRSWQCNIYAYHLKRLDEALDGANYILERDPTYVAALMVRAAISFHIGNKQQAATDWEEVLKLCPNDPEAKQIRKLIKKASS